MNSTLPGKGPVRFWINKPDVANQAILRCCQVWTDTYESQLAGGRGTLSSAVRANEAFRTAMPPLDSPRHIRDFIACVAYGLMVHSIGEKDGTHLLYAAQIATSHLKNASKRNPKSKPESQKTNSLRRSSGKKQDPPVPCEPVEVK
jgi:hypothetical protein